jgi:hypothetical protein
MGRYDERSAGAGAADDLDGAILQLIERMPCAPRADTRNFASARRRGS